MATAETKAKEAPKATVKARILPIGDGKVATGEWDHLTGYGYYAKGDVFEVAPAIAKELEARGFVEIQ